MPDLALIKEHFPFDVARDGQLEAMEFAMKAFESGKKYVAIEAPTGSGKSPIGVGVSKFFEKSYYLTIQKILQDQIAKDFGEDGSVTRYAVDLKGRNAYECPYYGLKADEFYDRKIISNNKRLKWKNSQFNCAEGHCKKQDKSKHEECIENHLCPYFSQVDKAMGARMCVMNFSSFLFQTMGERFKKRNILIIDEAHNTENQLLSFVSVSLSDSQFPITFPKYDTVEEYLDFFERKDFDSIIKEQMEEAKYADDTMRYEELSRIHGKLIHMEEAVKERKWVCEFKTVHKSNQVTFKPVYIDNYADELLFSFADHVLFMSATLLNVNIFMKSLGIEKEEYAARRMKSRFPVKNRRIIYKPCVKITGGKAKSGVWGPKLVKAVDALCNIGKLKDKKGIIHTHNFQIADILVEQCKRDVRSRFLYQKNFPNKNIMLQNHAESDNSIIVAPAMHEGLDLKDDLSRFQIICKIPFPNHYEDKQLAARMEDDPDYYAWVTALKLVQSVGRSVRSPEDHAITFIIDESFGWWHKQNKKMLPKWFLESIEQK